MRDIFDQIAPEPKGDIFDQVAGSAPQQNATPRRSAKDIAGDAAIIGTRAAINVPEGIAGLADVFTSLFGVPMGPPTGPQGQQAGPQASPKQMLEAAGYQPGKAKDILAERLSPAQKAAQAKVDEAEGVIGTAKAVVKNPSVGVQALAESVPSMFAGGLIGRTAKATKPFIGGALGEGTIATGAMGAEVSEKSGTLSPQQAALTLGSGALTALIGAGGGKLAQKFGFGDIETLLAATNKNPALRDSVVKSVVFGAMQEGTEELFQGTQEQVAQNIATGRPWDEGVDKAAVMSTLLGVTMGGGLNLATGASQAVKNVRDIASVGKDAAAAFGEGVQEGGDVFDELSPALSPTQHAQIDTANQLTALRSKGADERTAERQAAEQNLERIRSEADDLRTRAEERAKAAAQKQIGGTLEPEQKTERRQGQDRRTPFNVEEGQTITPDGEIVSTGREAGVLEERRQGPRRQAEIPAPVLGETDSVLGEETETAEVQEAPQEQDTQQGQARDAAFDPSRRQDKFPVAPAEYESVANNLAPTENSIDPDGELTATITPAKALSLATGTGNRYWTNQNDRRFTTQGYTPRNSRQSQIHTGKAFRNPSQAPAAATVEASGNKVPGVKVTFRADGVAGFEQDGSADVEFLAPRSVVRLDYTTAPEGNTRKRLTEAGFVSENAGKTWKRKEWYSQPQDTGLRRREGDPKAEPTGLTATGEKTFTAPGEIGGEVQESPEPAPKPAEKRKFSLLPRKLRETKLLQNIKTGMQNARAWAEARQNGTAVGKWFHLGGGSFVFGDDFKVAIPQGWLKWLNDNIGHDKGGDPAVKLVAKALQQAEGNTPQEKLASANAWLRERKQWKRLGKGNPFVFRLEEEALSDRPRQDRKPVAEMTDEETETAYYTNDLTGLPNRADFDERLASGEIQGGEIASLDINDLKKNNDQFGADRGDQMLIGVGRALQLAADITGARIWNFQADEFAIHGTPEQVRETAARARDWLNRNPLPVTLSDGSTIDIEPRFGYATGKTYEAADAKLTAEKNAEKEARGEKLESRAKEPDRGDPATGSVRARQERTAPTDDAGRTRGSDPGQPGEVQGRDVQGVRRQDVPAPQSGRTEPVTPSTYGTQNTVVTRERYEAAVATFNQIAGRANTGAIFDPEAYTALLTIATYHAEAGARSFSDFSKRLIDDIGDTVRPLLKRLYTDVRERHGFDGMEDAGASQDPLIPEEPNTDQHANDDGTVNEDVRVDSTLKALAKGGLGAFESATDRLRRSGSKILADLATRVDKYFDQAEARLGWINGKIRPALKQVKKKDMPLFAEYWTHQDNGRTAEAEAILKANPSIANLVEAVQGVFDEIGTINQTVDTPTGKGMKVYDSKIKQWRLIGKIGKGKFWPRAFKPEVQAVLQNPARNPELWSAMVDALIDGGHIETRDDARKFINNYFSREVSNDYFAGIEKARQAKLPEIFYDYSWNNFQRYSRKWSTRISQVEQFGQVMREGQKDKFDQAIDATLDPHTKQYIAALADNVYNRSPINFYTAILDNLNLIATGTQLGNPATATLNLVGGTTLSVQMFGFRRVAQAYAELVKGWQAIQQEGTELGILGKDVLNILRDAENDGHQYLDTPSKTKAALSKFTAATMKWGGYTGTENIIRSTAMVAAKLQLADALKAWNQNIHGAESKKYIAFMQRNRIDADKLMAENGEGDETSRYLRLMVNIPQGSYRADQVPLYVDNKIGRFLFKYQKFTTQVSRMFWQNHLQPFVKSLAGGEKITVKGKQERVRTFLPLLRYFAGATLGGTAILAARAALFGANDPGPDWDELEKALEDGDTATKWAMLFDRAFQSMMAASAFGFFGNYIKFGKDLADQQRAKNPLEPPGLASIDAVKELALRLMEQGTLTGRDLEQIGEKAFALYRGYKRLGVTVADAAGIENSEVKIDMARRDVSYAREVGRRYAKEAGIEAKRTSSGRMGKTEMSPVNQKLYEALIVGDRETARQIVRDTVKDLPGKERNNKIASMRASARARQPLQLQGAPSDTEKRAFLEWAKKNLPKSKYQAVSELMKRYDMTVGYALP
jgi:GGDEF domain-containing protein